MDDAKKQDAKICAAKYIYKHIYIYLFFAFFVLLMIDPVTVLLIFVVFTYNLNVHNGRCNGRHWMDLYGLVLGLVLEVRVR